jgi:hypothetical protein
MPGAAPQVGWFSLNVPSGLSLYYFSNTVCPRLPPARSLPCSATPQRLSHLSACCLLLRRVAGSLEVCVRGAAAVQVLTNLIQIWLKKLGGADVQINDLGPVTKLGAGRRTGAAGGCQLGGAQCAQICASL